MYDKLIDKTPTCHIWTGSMYPDGYGRVFINGQAKRAHRVIYEREVGNIPNKLVLNHLCRVRACVNPKHLEITTHKDNILKGNGLAAINARKTHCNKGHKFTPDNTYIYPKGNRACRICLRIHYKQSNAKRRK